MLRDCPGYVDGQQGEPACLSGYDGSYGTLESEPSRRCCSLLPDFEYYGQGSRTFDRRRYINITLIRNGIYGRTWWKSTFWSSRNQLITDWVIAGARQDDRFELVAVYSRKQETADAFAAKHQIPYTFTSLEEMAKSPLIDAVYIASPNSFMRNRVSCA